ncbi:MAG: hypothetical protein ACD_3C00167G0004 [uncultured bacterium (gcode 4)]|uniref:Uncharacterized protein n=1 Tax=uncultured bacterium (gcode 4) TaxID=1234023 RepID=K2F9D8_9BACT|nr:MAG: hypothetical protein ACD_3C00167G0004 [uncultured bacterium (gcode 4)]
MPIIFYQSIYHYFVDLLAWQVVMVYAPLGVQRQEWLMNLDSRSSREWQTSPSLISWKGLGWGSD